MAHGKSMKYSRRKFIKLAAAVTGSATLPSSLFAMDWETARTPLRLPPLKIGVLLPSSGMKPQLPENLMAGFALGVDVVTGSAGAADMTVLVESIGAGQASAAVKARKLLDGERVDLLVGFVNSAVASSLSPVLQEKRTPFISANTGEYLNREEDDDPSILRITLQYWQTHWAMGAWAARNLGKTAYIASSLYESGYDSSWAFELGFASQGGAITGRSLALKNQRPAGVLNDIAAIRPDFVYGLYSGHEAVDFVQAYAAAGLAPGIPLAGTGFLTEEDVLRRSGAAAAGIKSCFSWFHDFALAENSAFTKAFRRRHNSKADVFALLGYETALVMLAAVRKAAGQKIERDTLLAALRVVQLAGPRGPLRIDPLTGSVEAPLSVREVVIRQGRAVNQTIADVDPVSEFDREVRPIRIARRTGWHNNYLCV
jgi:branched-chain amino acid transport system substrate-binding protein